MNGTATKSVLWNRFYQPSGTYVQPQQMTQQQQSKRCNNNSSSAQAQYAISQGMLPLEQSYIENILRLNKGKQATVVMTYERGSSLGTQSYTGIIEAGRDHIVISEPQSGKRYLLLMIYLDYVEFPEEITYLPSQQATYTPRP